MKYAEVKMVESTGMSTQTKIHSLCFDSHGSLLPSTGTVKKQGQLVTGINV